MPKLLARALAFFFGVLWASPVTAAEGRLLLIDPDPELESAVRSSLSAWHTVVDVEKLAGPGSTMPGSAERARLLSSQRDAAAVVWISRSDDGFALWMYDARNDRVLARKLSAGPPFDEATAAGVALAIKTLLRHSPLPPPPERAQEPQLDYKLSFALMGGVRPMATTPASAEPRWGLSAATWQSLRSEGFRLGIGLEVSSGPGLEVEGRSFSGTLSETAVVAVLCGRLALPRQLDLTFGPGVGFDLVTIDGVVTSPAQNAHAVRVNGVLSADVELGYRLASPLRAALRASLVRPWRRQTYLVHGQQVLRVDPVLPSALVMLDVLLL